MTSHEEEKTIIKEKYPSLFIMAISWMPWCTPLLYEKVPFGDYHANANNWFAYLLCESHFTGNPSFCFCCFRG